MGENFTFPDGTTLNNITSDTVQTSYFPSLVTGCDSATIQTTLKVDSLNLNIIQNANVLTAEQTNVQYQWVKCDEGFANIPGATNQFYTANLNGSYACVLDNGQCTDTTVCRDVVNIGLDKYKIDYTVYPNPFIDRIKIETFNQFNIDEIRVIDSNGKQVKVFTGFGTDDIIHLDDLSPGIYFIEIISQSNIFYHKIQKVQ